MTVKLADKENAVENELVRRVRARGGICEKLTVPGRRGMFDRIVVLPVAGGRARIVFVECKRPKGGRFSPQQLLRHDQYRRAGAEITYVKNSEDIDALLT